MKKSKFITAFSAAFVAMIALTNCSGIVKNKGHVVLSVNGVEYTAEDLFNADKTPAAAEAKFNAVYRVAIRQYFKSETPEIKEKMAKITLDTKNKISGQKATAQSNADKNGTSYDVEWNKILTANNVEDEQGLYDKFEYDLQKEEFDNQFYDNDNIFNTLREGGFLPSMESESKEKIKGYFDSKFPYHVKHILVKVSAANGNNTRGEITANEANKLSLVITALANGTDFGQVAKMYSDDTGSGSNYGDLGIMDKDTSFVNEFKLGTYLYESFCGSSTGEDAFEYDAKTAKNYLFEQGSQALSDATAITTFRDPTVSDGTNSIGIGQIPYEAALLLGKNDTKVGTTTYNGLAEIDFKKQHFDQIEGLEDKAYLYPRNVIFNKYFNKHNIMFITPSTMKQMSENDPDSYVSSDYKHITKDDEYHNIKNDEMANLEGFKVKHKNEDNLLISIKDSTNNEMQDSILRDTKGRVIFVVRSGTTGDSGYQGIHFICIERSPFIGKEYFDCDPDKRIGATIDLNEYYTRYYPGQSGGHHPTYTKDGKTYDKPTYVNYFTGMEPKDLQSRADSVKSKIKGFDSNLNTYIYRYLLKNGNIKFSDNEVANNMKNDIDSWIDITKREDSEYTSKKSWNETWHTFRLSLEETFNSRLVKKHEIEGSTYYTSEVLPETCAIFFKNLDGSKSTDVDKIKGLFGKGGVFYHA